MDHDTARAQFRTLHESGTFLMPNPHDVGSCKLLTALGFDALATTSGGMAASLGRPDMSVSRVELCDHVKALAAATHLPLNVDAEQCFPHDAGGVSVTVALLAAVGASGVSIEDWDPRARRIEDRAVATERVAAAARAADEHGIVLTARCENHLRGVTDLDDTIARLCAYRDAGAHCVYAPVLPDLDAIARVVDATQSPVNVLVRPGGPTRDELASVGVRRLSVGGSLAMVAYGALVGAAERLLATGQLAADEPFLGRELATRAFVAPAE
jgi:2-methylisocitrate lyase-like PEP mutase family enzyme